MANEERVVSGGDHNIQLPNESVGEYILHCLRLHGDKIAQNYLDDGRKLTYAQIADQACSIAEELRARSVQVGDVIATCCHVCPEFPPIYLGSLLVGSTLATLNPLYDKHDFKHLLSMLEPKIIFTASETEETIRSVLSTLQIESEIIVLREQSPSWQTFLRHKDISNFQPTKLNNLEDTLALIMISSGTTGFPKGVTVSQKSLLLNVLSLRKREDFVTKNDRYIFFSPPFWITAPVFYSLGMVLGMEIFTGSKFTEEVFLRTVQEHKVTVTFLPANIVQSLAKSSLVKMYNIKSLRFIMSGGTGMSKEVECMVESALGLEVGQAYGMTEILIATIALPNITTEPGCSGILLGYQNCKVVDASTGRAVGPNTEGELCFKGPTLTNGYYRNPEATAAAIDKDGWVHSGDVGYYDENGLLYIVDRIKDLIKYRGHHLAPIEIESQLLEHPGVKEVAVVGIKHDLDMEHPLAVVVRQPGSDVTEQELVQLVAGRLAEHKWLRAGVHFRDSLPKTPTGKIQRREVRRMMGEGLRIQKMG